MSTLGGESPRSVPLRVIVEADGVARGNPGPAGYGALVREAVTGECLRELGAAIGTATNNVAEYRGLIAGLQAAADLGAIEVDVRMDSKLVVEQMTGRWQIRHPGLRRLAAQAAALVRRFRTVRFTWVPRERNQRADALANAAVDGRRPEDLEPEGAPDRLAAGRTAAVAPSPGWAPPETAATRLVLVRHGETGDNAGRRYSGRADTPLSPRGQAQARAIADRLYGLAGTVAAVYSSPLSRCLHTAEMIAARLGHQPPQVEEALLECDFGEWEGLTYVEVERRWPELVRQWNRSPAVAAPGGESMEAVAARVREFLPAVITQSLGRTLVLVSHVTPIKLILRDALAAGDGLLYRLYLEPGGISVVDYWADGAVAVRTINDTAHLDAARS